MDCWHSGAASGAVPHEISVIIAMPVKGWGKCAPDSIIGNNVRCQ